MLTLIFIDGDDDWQKNDGTFLTMPRSNLTILLRGDCSNHDFGKTPFGSEGVQGALMPSVPYYRDIFDYKCT